MTVLGRKLEDQEFKVALGYRVPSQPSKTKQSKKKHRLVVRVESEPCYTNVVKFLIVAFC